MVLGVSLVASVFYVSNIAKASKPTGLDLSNAFDTILEVTVRDKDGNIKDTRLKVGDLILTNFAEAFRGVISDITTSGETKYVTATYFKDEGGTTRSAVVKSAFTSSTGQSGFWGQESTLYPNTALAVGTGTNSPVVGNTDLQTEVESKNLIQTDAVYASGNVTFYGTVPITDTHTITEAGVYRRLAASSTYNYYLFIRDTFSGISVVASDTVTLSYTLVLGDGFTDNFGEILASFFPKNAVSSQTLSLTDDTGASFNTYIYGYQTNQWLFDTDVGTVGAFMRIGEGTTSPTRSDFDVETQVEGDAETDTSPIYENNINYTTQATWQVTADRDVTEVGYFLRTKSTAGVNTDYMIYRDTFTLTPITIGREITVSFKMYYNVTP